MLGRIVCGEEAKKPHNMLIDCGLFHIVCIKGFPQGLCYVSFPIETMKLDSHLECAFITVDPDRDTPDVMQKYLKGEFFHVHA